MKWKWVVALGAVAGGVVYVLRRSKPRSSDDPELWSAATDPVDRFGDE